MIQYIWRCKQIFIRLFTTIQSINNHYDNMLTVSNVHYILKQVIRSLTEWMRTSQMRLHVPEECMSSIIDTFMICPLDERLKMIRTWYVQCSYIIRPLFMIWYMTSHVYDIWCSRFRIWWMTSHVHGIYDVTCSWHMTSTVHDII